MSAGDVRGARVFVTGAHGFLGRFVCDALERAGALVGGPPHSELELRDGEAVHKALKRAAPDAVVHLAARSGGIGANQRNPATFWRDNTLMSVSVLEGCRLAGVPRLVSVGTVCAYPKHTPVPFREESLWDGFPEETNAPYGVAKRNLLMGALAYRREFGLGGAHPLPANLYGPGDDFDPQTSHVIPALIRKCEEARAAGRATVPVWGTGAASREFLFVADCAAAVVQAVSVDHAQPINLGTGREIVIRDLVGLVARATGFSGSFEWDTSRPDGQPRRVLDTSRARDALGWTAATTLEEGLEQTVAWFRSRA